MCSSSLYCLVLDYMSLQTKKKQVGSSDVEKEFIAPIWEGRWQIYDTFHSALKEVTIRHVFVVLFHVPIDFGFFFFLFSSFLLLLSPFVLFLISFASVLWVV